MHGEPTTQAFQAPLPGHIFSRFMLFWHAFFLGGLAVTLVIVFWLFPRPPGPWKWLLIPIAAAQAGLYFAHFVRLKNWPLPAWRLGLYFGSSLGLWFAAIQLDPRFDWIIWAYIGQMLGALPPKAALPGSGAGILAYLGWRLGWENIFRLNPWQLAMGVVMIAAFITLGLFLGQLSRTSSERAHLIQELEAARAQVELARQRDAELAVLRERERLARELHDSLGHALVTLAVQAEAVKRLYPVEPARAVGQLEIMKKLAQSSMEDLRRSLANLRAPGLGDRSLTAALHSLCADTRQRTGLTLDCQAPAPVDQLQPAVAEALWRVAQEGVTNAEKHAAAQSVRLAITLEPESVVLTVSDDGVGLPENAESQPGHYGLRGLRERVEGLGGTILLKCAKPKGTTVEARLPLMKNLAEPLKSARAV